MTHTKDEALKLEALVKEEMRYYHDGHYLDSSDAKYQLLSFAHRISKSVRASTPPPAEFVCSTGLCHYRKPLTAREIELIDGMIKVQLDHAKQCDIIANRTMADKQKGWDMERVALLQKLKELHT